MDHNQEFKLIINRATTPVVEPFLLVKVALNVDTTQLSTKDNLKLTNSYSHQPIKFLIWWKPSNLQIIKLQTTDIPKRNITSLNPKRKTAASSQKQSTNKTSVPNYRFRQIRVFLPIWFRILKLLMNRISILKMYWSRIIVHRLNRVR